MKNIIKLNITKSTFEKYLLSYGYNYKIKQYDDFILAIQRIAFNRVKNSDDLEQSVKEVYGTIPLLSFIYTKENINFISKDFLISLIEEGLIDLFITEKEEVYSRKIQKIAQGFKYLFQQNNVNKIKEGEEKLKQSKVIETIKALRCLEKGKIEINNETNKEIKKSVYRMIFTIVDFEYFSEDYSEFKYILKQLYSEIEEKKKSILDIFIENNFIFSEEQEISMVFPNKIKEIYMEDNKYILKKILVDKYLGKEFSVMNLKSSFYKYGEELNKEDEIKRNKMILKITKITKEDIKEIALKIKNNKNEISISLGDILD